MQSYSNPLILHKCSLKSFSLMFINGFIPNRKRFTVKQCLSHSWITRKHLEEDNGVAKDDVKVNLISIKTSNDARRRWKVLI
jgi:hypothetical protein